MPSLRISGAVARAGFVVAVLVSLVVLFAPGPDVPPSPPGVDKIVHASLFALLAATGAWAGLNRRVLVVALPVYAALSEVIQSLAPLQRDGSFGDLLADLAGVCLALLVWAAVTRRSRATR